MMHLEEDHSEYTAPGRAPRASPRGSQEPQLSVVVPCYNEELVIEETWRRVSRVCNDTVGADYELVLVNDGSRDRTWPIIRDIACHDRRVVGVNLSRNHGHQLALSAGLTVCRGQRVLIMDADLQDPPELLPTMMQAMDEGADVVYGQRAGRAGETWFKRTTAAVFYRLLARLADDFVPIDTGDFRLMSRRALDVLNAMPERTRFVRGMVSWIGFRQVPVRYRREARFAGETKYPIRKMLSFAIDAITSFSIVPLRFASKLGLMFGVVGLVVLLYVLWSWPTESLVQGWTSVISVVLILGSTQLLVLGIMGEYLGRMFLEVKRRPLFVVDEVVAARPSPSPDGSRRATPDPCTAALLAEGRSRPLARPGRAIRCRRQMGALHATPLKGSFPCGQASFPAPGIPRRYDLDDARPTPGAKRRWRRRHEASRSDAREGDG